LEGARAAAAPAQVLALARLAAAWARACTGAVRRLGLGLTCIAPAQVLALARLAAAWARRHSWGLLLVAALLVSGGMYAGGVALLRRRAGGEAGRAARAAIARSSLPAAAPGSVQARRGFGPAVLSRSAYPRLRPPAVHGRARRAPQLVAGSLHIAAGATDPLWACAGPSDSCQSDRLHLPAVTPSGLQALACQSTMLAAASGQGPV